MTNQNQQFQHRWEIRRTESDLDSSSDDDHSRPNAASEAKQVKQKLVSGQNLEKNVQQSIHRPTSYARREKDKLSGLKKPKRKVDQPGKTRERKAKTKGTKKTTSSYELAPKAASFDLSGHMQSLVEEIKTARRDLLAWMEKEMKSPSKDDITSTKPSGTRKDQKQNTTRSKIPRKNTNSRRKKSGNITQNDEGGSIGKSSPLTIENDVVPPKETENVTIDVIPVDNVEKKGKRSRPRQSAKKQKTVQAEADQQSKTTVAAAADNYLTLPTVLPHKQVENSEQNPSEDGNEKDGGKRTALNSGTSLSSPRLKFDPRPQQNDVAFAQNGAKSVSNYEQNTSPTIGNGNGHGFPFPVIPQGSNGGIRMPNIHNQFGLQYLSQGNRTPGMYREHPGFPSGFIGSYSGLNQHPIFNAQQSGVMGLQCPDIRRGAFNQGNTSNQ